MKPPDRWTRAGGLPPLGRRPARLTAAEREAWDELVRLRNQARMRVNRARIRDDPALLSSYLARNAREAMRYRARIGGGRE